MPPCELDGRVCISLLVGLRFLQGENCRPTVSSKEVALQLFPLPLRQLFPEKRFLEECYHKIYELCFVQRSGICRKWRQLLRTLSSNCRPACVI
jgi:hypothetical protein